MNALNLLPLWSVAIVNFCLLFCLKAEAASFDCEKAATKIEKVICSNETVSQYDEELGQYYKEALLKYPDKKEMLVRQQRNWIKWIRNSCSDPSCLATLYSARLGEVRRAVDIPGLDGTEKPNFIVVEGNGEPLCEEYLTILNRTPRNELKACKLPDLTGSAIQPVEFKPLIGEALKSMDKIVYEQNGGGPHLDWEQKWLEREKEYAAGYRKLSEAYWDLDNDGEKDHIVNESFPYLFCVTLNPGEARVATKSLKKDWGYFSSNQQQFLGNENGYVNFYKVIKNGKLNFIDAENFVLNKGEYLSINHQKMRWKNSNDPWSDKLWIDISKIDSKLKNGERHYRTGKSMCGFWFND